MKVFVAGATGAIGSRLVPQLAAAGDDEPAPVRAWLPFLADQLGAPEPRRVPRVVSRLLGGEAAAIMLTEVRGASNAKARRELGWELRWPTWRLGFAKGLDE